MPLSSSWVTGSGAVPCPYCSNLCARSHQERCEKRIVPCTQCGSLLPAAALLAHMSAACTKRKAACPGVGCGETVFVSELQQHIMVACSARSFTCVSCGEAFWIAAEFIQHAFPRCKREVVGCQLCGQAISTSDLAEHYAQCAQMALRQASPARTNDRHQNLHPQGVSPWDDRCHDGDHLGSAPVALRSTTKTHQRPTSAPFARAKSPLHSSPAALRKSVVTTSANDPFERQGGHSPEGQEESVPPPPPPPREPKNYLSGTVHRPSSASVRTLQPAANLVSPFEDTSAPSRPSSSLSKKSPALQHLPTPTHSSELRRDCSASRTRSGSSLAVKDYRLAVLSESTRRRELAERLKLRIASNVDAVLPSCIVPPSPVTASRSLSQQKSKSTNGSIHGSRR